MNIEKDAFTPEEWETCIKVLKVLSRNPEEALDVMTLKGLVTKLYKTAKKTIRKESVTRKKENDYITKSKTILHQLNPLEFEGLKLDIQPETFEQLEYEREATCYVCKKPYTKIHFFYHLLCPDCAKLNYEKRQQSADLKGRTALITGGRIKIGYETALKMLRDGAKVIVTTRFPKDAAQKFSVEADFDNWSDRLHIFGLDLRNIPSVERFVAYMLQNESKLDIIINNAAQTVKRPLGFYQHLLDFEQTPFNQLDANIQKMLPLQEEEKFYLIEKQHQLALPNQKEYFPINKFDLDGQQLDLRPQNSWVLKMEEVDTVELLEVHLVNAVSPFMLNSKLKPLLLKSEFERKFIVNVSAMEGQFNRQNKTANHPHTNMAKAALNMLTRTSAQAYAKEFIYMNSVDTGWITEENPHPKKSRIRKRGFVPPLDVVDGMARIYDPVVRGINEPEEPLFGYFLKDYFPYEW